MQDLLKDNFSFFPPHSIWDWLVVLFLFMFLVQAFYYLYFFTKVAFYKQAASQQQTEPVSVIVCAKNERENLLEYLPLILTQDYPDFEVIVVNDCSVDDTQDVLKAFSLQHNNLKIVTVPDNDRFYGNKKLALTLGIKAAKNKIVLLTDADCKPTSDQWIRLMTAYENPQKKLILGVGNYEQQPGLLNKLIRFETFYTAIQYTSFALRKLPYMGVGRNLSYQTDLFFGNKGFASHHHIISGDDDLFVNEVANHNNTQIVLNTNAHTISKPKTTFKKWFRQKQRHFLSGSHYKFKHQVLLGVFMSSNLFFVGLFFLLVFQKPYIHLIVGVFLLKYIIQMLIFRFSTKQLGNEDIIIYTPIFEIIFMFLNPILVISNFTKKRTQWN